MNFAPDSASAPGAGSEPWSKSRFCSPVTVMGPCQWTPHEDEPSEPAPPTLPCPQGAAPVCADRVADPISAPNHLDSLPHPRQPRHPQSPPPPHSTALSASEPLCATPRTEAKPIKDRPSSCGLAHCTVCSVFAAMKIILLIGYSAPRNRANLFQSRSKRQNFPHKFNTLQPTEAKSRQPVLQIQPG